MKSFALALFAATASASLSEVMSFEFDQYFTKVEAMPAKRLESYTYGWEKYGPAGSDVESDPFWKKIPFDTIGFILTLGGDFNFQFTTPFENTDDETQWTLAFVPEINLGGKQKFAADLTKYFSFDLTLDLWPASFKFMDTEATWTPPFFNDLCWKSTWSTTLWKLYADLHLGLWECDAGLFDFILNDNTHDCGLTAYKFDNHIIHLSWDANNMGGDLFPETCFAVSEEEPIDNNNDVTEEEEATDVETTGLSSDVWF